MEKSNNKKQLLKSGVIVLSVSILSACHTMQTEDVNKRTIFGDMSALFKKQATGTLATQNFAEVSNVQEQNAKEQLSGAMQMLLNSERTVATEYYYQVEPSTPKESLNEGADSLFATILKIFNHQDEEEDKKTATNAYRTMADYTPLGEDKGELYLRYYDEVDDTRPTNSYAMSRLDGMSERMQATDAAVYQLNKGYQACVQSFSYEIDGLVDSNPAITSDDKAVKSALAVLDDCTKEQDIVANRIRTKQISAYHRQDMAMGHICASNYRRSLMDALSPKRTQKRYDQKDGSYDAYDSVYAQYSICHSVFMNSYRSDPVVYINNGDSKLRLDGLREARACGIEFTDGVAALYQAGMSYRTHAKEHQGLVYAHLDCLMDSAEKLYNEDGEYTYALSAYETPTNRIELAQALKLYQEMASSERSPAYQEETTESRGRFGWLFDKYFSIKKEELENNIPTDNQEPSLDGLGSSVYGRVANEVIKSMAQTPEQIAATNHYAYNHTKLTVLSKHSPKNYRSDVVMSLDFESPTAVQSVQVPFSYDYKSAKLAIDADALLPVLAIIAPEQTPLAKDFQGDVGVVNFAMPKELQGIIPMELVYDSAIKGFVAGLKELHNNNFSTVDIRNDTFAKKQGATSAIKVNLDLRQTGELLAIISKQVIKDLTDFVEKNPEFYREVATENLSVADSLATQKTNEQKQKIKNAIEKWALLDKGFVSADIGGLFAAIDGLLPMDYYQSNYYYFNAQGALVGQVARQDLDDNFGKVRTKTVAMTSFKQADFDNHYLAKKVLPLTDSFSFDGNAWLSEQKQLADLKKDALNLRYDYDKTDGVLSDK